MSAWTLAWIGWAVYFAIVEGWALVLGRTSGTLSGHVWAFLGSSYLTGKQPSGWTRLRRFLTLAFLAWLVAHFLTGGWF